VAERQPELVSREQIRAAVAALEQRRAAGEISDADVARRVNDCRRAVTPRDLWRASGGLAGAPRRGDWWDVRRTVGTLLFILVLCALGAWLVTWALGLAEGELPAPIPLPSPT
jgi:hypothetical protein